MAYKDKQTQKNRCFFQSLKYAIKGAKTAFIEERNFRYHCLLACLAILFSILFKLSLFEWIWVTFVIFLVMLMELINTMVENLVDMVTNYTYHPLGEKVKDIGAATVLLSAMFALIIAGCVFIPKVWSIIQTIL